MATSTNVEIEEVEPGIVVVTMNRPDRLNALSQGLIADLHHTFETLGADRSVRVIVLTGAGRGFCAGADIKGVPGETGAPGTEGMAAIPRNFVTQEHLASLHERIHRLRQPVIAAINGVAVGGGFALALSCDIRFAAPTARFGAVFITLGVSACDMGTSYLLPRLVGASRAAELMLTGRIFDAEEARRMDLVLDVVAQDALIERALVTARQIAALSPLAVWMTKETMWQTIDAPSMRHALDMENRTQIMLTATGEMTAAFEAFREGRPATWQSL
ncbi:MAG: putative enoyl-CoA hydratase/isomerase [Ilumatobacteraceae bacterium]|nr:putative enoyl-CoA hydratase/isomerase [Ilumatobacteraceae bacterium]